MTTSKPPRVRAKRYLFAPAAAVMRSMTVLGDNSYVGERARSQADVLGVDRNQILRWLDYGLTIDQAEAVAETLRLHVFELWPEIADDVFADTETERRAREAAWVRRRRQNNPELQEADRQRARGYYAECGDYVRAAERRRYWADPEKARQRKRDARRNPEIRERERLRAKAYYAANADRLRAAERERKAARRRTRAEEMMS